MEHEKLVLLGDVDLIPAANSEDTDYSEVTVQNGYGKVAEVMIEATAGACVDVNVDVKVKMYAEDCFQQATQELESRMDDELLEEVEKCKAGKKYGNWFLCLFCKNKKEYEEYSKTKKEHITDVDTKVQETLQKHFGQEGEDFHIKGKVTVKGLSNVPAMARICVKLLQVTTKDGSKKTVIDKTPDALAVGDDGDTSKFELSDILLDLTKD